MTAETMLRQSYPDWEMWLPPQLSAGLDDERFRPCGYKPTENSAEWFNRVIDAVAGEYLLPIPSSAVLAPHALLEVVAAITSSGAPDLVYSDEDRRDEAGMRMAPRFKPSWDPELMLGRNVVGNLGAYRTARVREVGGADAELPNAEAFLYDLALRTAAMPESRASVHIPAVLFSMPFDALQSRALDGPTARRIVAAHLVRRGERDVSVLAASRTQAWNRIIWPVPAPAPTASIIVPTRDQPAMLSRCAEGVLTRTDYPDFELLIVDNGSTNPDALAVMRELDADERVRLLRYDAPFNFSSLNNFASRHASGSVLVLLNDDTEVIGSGWLRELVAQALRPEIGIVGARLLYPTGQVQHAGIVLTAGKPHHQYRLCDAADLGAIGELALTRSVSAVTAACMALRKSVFEEVGGLNEDLKVALGDVDICLRVAARGYRIICTPFAELYHHESASRGYEDTAAKRTRFAGELESLRRRWSSELQSDRYANPNLLFGWDDTGAWGLPRSVQPRRPRRSLCLSANSRLVAVARRSALLFRGIATPVIPNPLFSSTWYLANYPEVASYRLGPYQHYRHHGVAEERNPNHLFDTRWYLKQNPDVAASGLNPLDHYLRYGASEGRDPSPQFSTGRYLAENPEVRAAGHNPLLHCLLHPAGGHRRPRRD